MLYTKCICKPKEESDGLRISVMSRHTLNDGVTLDDRITVASYDEWIKELAPPNKLVGDYYKRELPWQNFEERYLEHIRSKEISYIVQELAIVSTFKAITLLCCEETPEFCHRRLLAEECKKYSPWLNVLHK